MRQRVALVLVVCLFPTLAAAQQAHPNRASGFQSETLYTVGADNINLFNGGLSFSVPIGEPIPVGPNLKLGVQLNYTSKPWATWNLTNCEYEDRGHQLLGDGDRIFGLGWQAHFGRLVDVLGRRLVFEETPCSPPLPPPQSPPAPPTIPSDHLYSTGFGYQTPDGSIHEFYDRLDENAPAPPEAQQDPANYPVRCWDTRPSPIGYRETHPGSCYVYTHDGSFLRLDPVDPDHGNMPVVYFPDGTIHILGFAGGRRTVGAKNGSFDWSKLEFGTIKKELFGQESVPRHVTEMRDRFGNAIKISYYGDGINDCGQGCILPDHPHPLAGAPEEERDVIPFRAFTVGQPYEQYLDKQYIEFGVQTDTVVSWGVNEVRPRVNQISVPDPNGGPTRRTYSLTVNSVAAPAYWYAPYTHSIPQLNSIGLPESLTYSFTYPYEAVSTTNLEERRLLTGITLPSGGQLLYTYDTSYRYSYQSDKCLPGTACDFGYAADQIVVVKYRTERRSISTDGGTNFFNSDATTTYNHNYRNVNGLGCSSHDTPENCILRVDVWSPVAYDPSGVNNTTASNKRVMTRTVFGETNGSKNRPLYGRPIQTCDFLVNAAYGVLEGPSFDGTGMYQKDARGMCDSDSSNANYRPFRTTRMTYDFDGPRVPVSGESTAYGFSHNTREQYRILQWFNPTNGLELGRLETTNGYLTPPGPWLGHWYYTEEKENRSGVTKVLKQQWRQHKDHVTNWILEPVTARTVKRPQDSDDGGPAVLNLATDETFSVDDVTGFVTERSVRQEENNQYGSTHVTKWTMGTQASAPCLVGGGAVSKCGNRGFPTSEEVYFSGDDPGAKYTRQFFYQYGVLSAAYDEGTSFYAIDRDISVTGKIVGERDTNGRTSLEDTAPVLAVKTAYDGLGREVSKRQMGADSVNPEDYAMGAQITRYGPQDLTTYRCKAVNPTNCGGVPSYIVSLTRVLFDQLGRPTAEIRRMPLDGGYTHAYRVRSYDLAGRPVAQTEWIPKTCTTDLTPCSELLNNQMTVGQTSILSNSVGVPGRLSWSFDGLGRPGATRQLSSPPQLTLDESTMVYSGWWGQDVYRPYNKNPESISIKKYEKDGLGRLVKVTEPSTKWADDSTSMNPQEETTYRYDHFDRLIRARKTGSDHTANNSQIQERWWKYDDFGWLLEESTPEVPTRQFVSRDARGNPTRVKRGGSVAGTYDEIVTTYDKAGRPLQSEDPNLTDSNPSHIDPFELFHYDTVPSGYPPLVLGRSNGKLVMANRRDHVVTNRQASSQVDFGLADTVDLFHYVGYQGQMEFRQRVTYQISGPPSSPRSPLAGSNEKSRLVLSFEKYFESQGRKHGNAREAVEAGAVLRPVRPSKERGPKGPGREAMVAAADNPDGWLNWWYIHDDEGRLDTVHHPRRNEAYRTTDDLTYSHGFVTKHDVWLVDPFVESNQWHVIGDLTYNPSGSVRTTDVQFDGDNSIFTPSTRIIRVTTEDQGSQPRVASWLVEQKDAADDFAYETLDYDKSGNVTARGAWTLKYDARGHLIKELNTDPEPDIDRRYTYDGFGNLTWYAGALLSPSRTNNQLLGGYTWDTGRGYLLGDTSQQMDYDWYVDGRNTAAYKRTATHQTQPGPGISARTYDTRGEGSLFFWGDAMQVYTASFRHPVRDENGRALTDYQGQPFPDNPPCGEATCTGWKTKWQKDFVSVGPYVLMTRARNDATLRVHAKDYLGTTRFTFNQSGDHLGATTLFAFGTEQSVFPESEERHRFTAHERLHVPGQPGSALAMTDYMHNRDYSPVFGRFLSPDMAGGKPGDPQSWTRYTYALNNPLKYVDPDGNAAARAGWQIAMHQRNEEVRAAFVAAASTLPFGGSVVGALLDSQLLSPLFPGHHEASLPMPAMLTGPGGGTIRGNAAQGAAFEEKVAEALQETQTGVVRQVTVKTQSGVRTRLDFVGTDASGELALTEAKSSSTAPLTPKQKVGYPEIAKTGGVVVGKGKPGVPGGTQIPPKPVRIVRPDDPPTAN